MACEFCPEGDGVMTVDGGSFASTCGIATVVLRWVTILKRLVHDFKFFVRFCYVFWRQFDFNRLSGTMQFWSSYKKSGNAKVDYLYDPAHTQALMSAAESRHRRRNPPSAAVPCRQPIRCQPVWPRSLLPGSVETSSLAAQTTSDFGR